MYFLLEILRKNSRCFDFKHGDQLVQMVIVCRDTIVSNMVLSIYPGMVGFLGALKGSDFPPENPKLLFCVLTHPCDNESAVWEEKTKMSLEDFLRAESKTFRLEAGKPIQQS